MQNEFTLKNVLKIIFDVTKKSAGILSHSYLLKDQSIISKWKNNKAFPRNDDVARIVEFVVEESTYSQKNIIRDRITKLILSQPVNDDIKDIILHIEDFSGFLKEAISASISVKSNDEILSMEKSRKPSSSCFSKKSGENYKGILEFDMQLPKGNDTKISDIYKDAGIEFTGKFNIVPKKQFMSFTRQIVKASTLCVTILVAVFAVALSNSHGNVTGKELKVFNQKTTGALSKLNPPLVPKDSPLPAIAILSPDRAILPSPAKIKSETTLPQKTSQPTLKPKKNVQKKNIAAKKNINNNTNKITNDISNKNTITNEGDNAFIVQGSQIFISFSKD